MDFGKSKDRVTGVYKLEEREIKKVEFERDLGVFIIKHMSPDKQINKIAGETYNLLRSMQVAL